MPGKIIVGFDASDGARDAVAFGQQLAEATGRTLALVCVRPPHVPDWAEGGAQREDELAKQAQATLQSAPVAPAVERQAVCGDSVAGALRGVAESEEATVVVVGCPTRTQTGRIEAGTIAQRLLHGSPCAVALAPRGYATHHPEVFDRIVVGYTDSEEARAAVRTAASLGRACDAVVRVVSVTGKVPSWSVDLGGYADAVRDTVQNDLDTVLRRLASSVATEGVVLDGDPVDELLDQADGWADLIVTGSRGYGPARQVLLGSVSAGILGAAAVPVIVTPRGVETELVASRGTVAADC